MITSLKELMRRQKALEVMERVVKLPGFPFEGGWVGLAALEIEKGLREWEELHK